MERARSDEKYMGVSRCLSCSKVAVEARLYREVPMLISLMQ